MKVDATANYCGAVVIKAPYSCGNLRLLRLLPVFMDAPFVSVDYPI